MPSQLEQAAADSLFSIPGVEQVRMEQRESGGITFWVVGKRFRGQVLDQVIEAGFDLHDRFHQAHVLVEIIEHFGRPQEPFVFWEQFQRVTKTTSAAIHA